MTHNYYTLEQFAQTRQQELLVEAEQQRLVASVLDLRSKQIQRITGRAIQLLLIVVVAVALVHVLDSSMLHLMAAHHFSPQAVQHLQVYAAFDSHRVPQAVLDSHRVPQIGLDSHR